MPHPLRKHACPTSWDSLDAIEGTSPDVKFCSKCQEQVHRVLTVEEGRALSAQGLCVAIMIPDEPFIGFIPPEGDRVNGIRRQLQVSILSEPTMREKQIERLALVFALESWCSEMITSLRNQDTYSTPLVRFTPFDGLREKVQKDGITIHVI
jgi:hypothetical protein